MKAREKASTWGNLSHIYRSKGGEGREGEEGRGRKEGMEGGGNQKHCGTNIKSTTI